VLRVRIAEEGFKMTNENVEKAKTDAKKGMTDLGRKWPR
jgi:hypothetical protein